MSIASPPAVLFRRLASLALTSSVRLGACFQGDGHFEVATPEPTATTATTATTAVLATSTAEVSEATPISPGSVPLVAQPPPAPESTSTPAATPEAGQGVAAVVQPDVTVTVAVGGRVVVAGTGWTIRFVEVVEDSRCPIDVQCIWAGQVVVRLVGEHSDGLVTAVLLTIGPGERGSGLIGDLRVEGVGVEPARRAGTSHPADYSLRLRASLVSTTPAAAVSGVHGHITIGPMCPVMRIDQPCPDRPFQATLEVRNISGALIARIDSTADGAYMLPLPPGKYVMEPQMATAVRLPSAGAHPFEVHSSAWTSRDIPFDSGIR